MSERGPKRLTTTGLRVLWLRLLEQRFSYEWGGKLHDGPQPRAVDLGVDCSGTVQWLLKFGTVGGSSVPDGSIAQGDWCEAQGFERVHYSDAVEDTHSNAVYLACFNHGGHGRHVWLIQNGRTMESYGGHGPGSRAALTNVLYRNAQRCFKLS